MGVPGPADLGRSRRCPPRCGAAERRWRAAHRVLTASLLFIPHRLHDTVTLAQLRQAGAHADLEQLFKPLTLPDGIPLSTKLFPALPRVSPTFLNPLFSSETLSCARVLFGDGSREGLGFGLRQINSSQKKIIVRIFLYPETEVYIFHLIFLEVAETVTLGGERGLGIPRSTEPGERPGGHGALVARADMEAPRQ